jgi:Acyl-CoA dehydrogenase, N-terminal domain
MVLPLQVPQRNRFITVLRNCDYHRQLKGIIVSQQRCQINYSTSTNPNDEIRRTVHTNTSVPSQQPVSSPPSSPGEIKNAFLGSYDWLDPFQLYTTGLTSDERAIQESVRQFAKSELLSQIIPLHRNEPTHDESRRLIQLFGNHGLFGVTLPEKYTNHPTLGYVSYGLITTELERIDSSYRSAVSVQSSLVMYPIVSYAQSDSIRQKYVPFLASGEYIGCFGLTESNHGSDPGGMETKAIYDAGTDGLPMPQLRMFLSFGLKLLVVAMMTRTTKFTAILSTKEHQV